ncbi:hypothetical protein niasHT_016417 [Heterodera trifolii]|uniref:glucuronosyltransferase n=1 Tax=Heterodera trifolii TaxID=157864 RepID=A0ABD2LJ05_9BILA
MAFVSHCGMNSVLEGIYNGKPIICVPLFADQFYNGELLARQNIGLVVDGFVHTKIFDFSGNAKFVAPSCSLCGRVKDQPAVGIEPTTPVIRAVISQLSYAGVFDW